jgi:hypothetical protein
MSLTLANNNLVTGDKHMKIITWILLFCFVTQAIASNIKEGLELAMNDFEYEMVVEWDQKDIEIAEKISKKFSDRLDALYLQGLSNDEVMKYIETRVLDKKHLEVIKAAANLASKENSASKNIAIALQKHIEKFGQRGASWTDSATNALIISGVLVLAALLVSKIIWNLNHSCAEAQMEEECGYGQKCTDWDYGPEGSYCEDYDSVYSCANVEVCLKWTNK